MDQKPAHEIFREAANLLDKGWMRGEFGNGHRYCLVGALDKTVNGEITNSMKFMREEGYKLMAELNRHPKVREYRVTQPYLRGDFGPGQTLIEFNDSRRTRRPVVKVLRETADRVEQEWLQTQAAKVPVLQEQIRVLKERIVQLETANTRLLNRLANRRQLQADNKILEDLEKELDRVTENL